MLTARWCTDVGYRQKTDLLQQVCRCVGKGFRENVDGKCNMQTWVQIPARCSCNWWRGVGPRIMTRDRKYRTSVHSKSTCCMCLPRHLSVLCLWKCLRSASVHYINIYIHIYICTAVTYTHTHTHTYTERERRRERRRERHHTANLTSCCRNDFLREYWPVPYTIWLWGCFKVKAIRTP